MRSRHNSRQVDGILLLDKPVGLTSNAALQQVKRLFRAERAGHTGTLDPLATGLLPICMGEATKFGGALLEADKGYDAAIKLGERTATGDAEGPVIERRTIAIDRENLNIVLDRFRGEIEQIPPMYSALKHQGRSLYELARKGQVVERKPRRVHIRKLNLERFEDDFLFINVICSKGTYVRTLAEDIGAALGCGAHLAGLRRTSVGEFMLEQTQPFDRLGAMDEPNRDRLLLAVDALVRSWPRVVLPATVCGRFLQGQAVSTVAADGTMKPYKAAVYDDSGKFIGVGKMDESGILYPHRLLSSH